MSALNIINFKMRGGNGESIEILGNKDIKFETKFDFLNKNLYFHQVIKQSPKTRHYITEDISNIDIPAQPIFYYLKQMIFSDLRESQTALLYYTQFGEYCKSPFAKTEIAKLLKMHHIEDQSQNYYELVLLFEYGDSDRIDVEVIESEQVMRFIKNICILLDHIYKFNKLTNNNLNLKNIVLCNNELKISGFKPIFFDKDLKTWKQKIAHKYGLLRLELFCIGLIWINFINLNITNLFVDCHNIDQLQKDLLSELKSVRKIPKSDLLESLINLSENPTLVMENIILQFDEYFILEKISDTRNNKTGAGFNDTNNSIRNTRNEDSLSKASNNFSSDENYQKLSSKEDDNLFKKTLKDSQNEFNPDIDKSNHHEKHGFSNRNSAKRGHSDMVLNEQFSIVHKDVPDGNSKISGEPSKDGIKSGFGLMENGISLKLKTSEHQFSSLDPNKFSVRLDKKNGESGTHHNSMDKLAESLPYAVPLKQSSVKERISEPDLSSDRNLTSETRKNPEADLNFNEPNSQTSNKQSTSSIKNSKKGSYNSNDLRISDKLDVKIPKRLVESSNNYEVKSELKDIKLKPVDNKDPSYIQNMIPRTKRNSSKNLKDSMSKELKKNLLQKNPDFKKKTQLIEGTNDGNDQALKNRSRNSNDGKNEKSSDSQNVTSKKISRTNKNDKSKTSKNPNKKKSLLDRLQSNRILKPDGKFENGAKIPQTHSEPIILIQQPSEVLEDTNQKNENLLEDPVDLHHNSINDQAENFESLGSSDGQQDFLDHNPKVSEEEKPENKIDAQFLRQSIDNKLESQKLNQNIFKLKSDALFKKGSKIKSLKTLIPSMPGLANENRLKSKNFPEHDSSKKNLSEVLSFEENPTRSKIGVIDGDKSPIKSQSHAKIQLEEKTGFELHDDDKSFSGLTRHEIEIRMQKRKNEETLHRQSEKEMKKKQLETAKPKLPSPDHQKRIEDFIKTSLHQKIYNHMELVNTKHQLLIEKDKELKTKNQELFERLKKKAEEKYAERKNDEFSRYKNKRRFLNKLAQDHEPFNPIKPLKPQTEFMAKEEKPNLRRNTRSPSCTPQLRRELSENILGAKQKRSFDLSPLQKVDRKFQFNHKHQVFQIPFRKVLENFKDLPVHQTKQVKAMRRSLSVNILSPNNNIFDKFEETLGKYKEYRFEHSDNGKHNSQQLFGTNSSEPKSNNNYNTAKQFNIFLDDIPLTKNLKIVESEKSKDFNSLAKKIYRPENEPNELDYSNINHIDFKNNALPNPIKEFKEYTIFKNDQIYIPISNNAPYRLRDFAEQCQIMLSTYQLDEVLTVVSKKTEEVVGSEVIELNKIISSIFYCIDDFDKAKEELLNAIENVNEMAEGTRVPETIATLIFNLAFIEFLIGDIKDSIEMLKNPIVDKHLGPQIRNIMGNSFMALNKPKYARELYQSEMSQLLKQNPTLTVIVKSYQLVNKILQSYKIERDKIGPAQFFKELVASLSNVSNLYKQLDKDATRPYEGVLDLIIFRFLHFGEETKNYGLMNFVLEKSIKHKTLSHSDNLSIQYKVDLIKYMLSVCEYLKNKPNYGGFEKNYIMYLELSDSIVNSCEVNLDTLRLNLMLLFHKGIYSLQKNDFPRARKNFQSCFEVLKRLGAIKGDEIYKIIHDLAIVFSKKLDFENAIFFYEEFKKFEILDEATKILIDQKLPWLYFWNRQYKECCDILESYVKKCLFNVLATESHQKVMKNVCLFRLSTWYSNPERFDETQKLIEQRAIFTRNPVILQYVVLFKLVEGFMVAPSPISDNARILTYLEAILKNRPTIPFEKGSEILDFTSVLFSKVSKDKLNILHILKEDLEHSQKNIQMICQFIENSIFCFIFALKTHPDYSNQSKFELLRILKSQDIREELRHAIESKWEITEDVESKYISMKVNEIKEKIANDLLDQRSKTQDELKLKTITRAGLEAPDNAQEILRRSHFNKIDCNCSDDDKNKHSPTKLIEQFLRQLKNMMFLDVIEDILTYYNRFESIIKEKNWNWHKFSYIPLLFNFYKQSSLKNSQIDKMKFIRILDEILDNLEICVHDLKMIVLLLESFKKIEFLEVFVMYLHKVHPKLANLIFNWVFLENFDSKFENIIAQLYQKLYAFQFYQFENFSLMHFLNIENVLEIEKKLSFRIYKRYRYDLLADDRFKKVFAEYIDSQTLELFYFRYATYATIVGMHKQPSQSQVDALIKFQDSLFKHTQNIIVDSFNFKFFTYDFLLVVNFVNLKTNPEAKEFIIEVINHLKRKISKVFSYHFAILASHIGNYFFKFRMFRECVKVKTLALEALKGIEDEPKDFPQYVTPVDLKSLLFGIISFLYLSFWEMKDFEQSQVFISKLLAYDYESELLNLEKDLLKILSLITIAELDKANELLLKVRNDYSQMMLRTKLESMFFAAFDKLDLMIAEKRGTEMDLQEKRRVSKLSIETFLKPL